MACLGLTWSPICPASSHACQLLWLHLKEVSLSSQTLMSFITDCCSTSGAEVVSQLDSSANQRRDRGTLLRLCTLGHVTGGQKKSLRFEFCKIRTAASKLRPTFVRVTTIDSLLMSALEMGWRRKERMSNLTVVIKCYVIQGDLLHNKTFTPAISTYNLSSNELCTLLLI